MEELKKVIEVKNLSVNFKDKNILNDISFRLESGKIYGFLGNNGAGKTTTIKVIFNELVSKKGTVTYNQQVQKNIDYSNWYFFVENNELPLNLTINEYLQIMVTLAKKNYKKAKDDFAENEKIFNIKFKRSKKIKSFSAGERKILSALMLLILNPEIIFFDEPTANLDLKNKEIIINIMKLMKTENRIIVITTHLIDEVKDFLTDLIILDEGKIKYAKSYSNKENLRVIFNENTNQNSFSYETLDEKLNSTSY